LDVERSPILSFHATSNSPLNDRHCDTDAAKRQYTRACIGYTLPDCVRLHYVWRDRRECALLKANRGCAEDRSMGRRCIGYRASIATDLDGGIHRSTLTTVIDSDGASCYAYIRYVGELDRPGPEGHSRPRRLDAAKKTLEDMGGHFRSLHMTMGQFDLIGIYEAPDDAIAARYILTLGQLGNVRTVSMKAFPEEAYRMIVNSLQG
jgi:uncharacterized protein with GYD domain